MWKKKETVLHEFYKWGSFKTIASAATTPMPASIILPSPDYTGLDTDNPSLSVSEFHPISTPVPNSVPPHSNALYLALMFWTFLTLFMLVTFLIYPLIRWWTVINITIFITASVFTGGTHLIEITLFRIKEHLLSHILQKEHCQ